VAVAGLLVAFTACLAVTPEDALGAPTIRTVVGSASLRSPAGIAVDGTGDLFIADTNNCRVALVPSRSGVLYGLSVKTGHLYTLVGGRCAGNAAFGFPTGVAVDQRGDLFIAIASADKVLELAPGGSGSRHSPVSVAGTGRPGYTGAGLVATQSALHQPTGVAVDAAGNLFIADTANCLVRVVPAASGNLYGQSMQAGHLYNVVGTGTCGTVTGGPARASDIWGPVAVAIDHAGDVVIADNGDQTVIEMAVNGGTYYGTTIGAGDVQAIIGVVGTGNNPYLVDGLSATSIASEVNDPQGLALASDGTLFVTDGRMHCIRVVPNATMDLSGRSMGGGDLYTLAGALPVSTKAGAGNGTRWILTHMDVPVGIAVTSTGAVLFSDRGTAQVRELR